MPSEFAHSWFCQQCKIRLFGSTEYILDIRKESHLRTCKAAVPVAPRDYNAWNLSMFDIGFLKTRAINPN